MEPLLFLAHRLPYPPNKGDKVRSYHFLAHLAKHYRVHLGTFIDDPADWQHVAAVKARCAEVHVEALVPWAQRARSTTGFLRGEALTLPYFRSRRLKRWVQEVTRREGVMRTFVFSSAMAQYVLDLPRMRCFVDLVDMDSAKWDDYARTRSWPVSTIYRREARRLLAHEREIAARAEATIFVTDEETQAFRKEIPDGVGRLVTIRNGVDSTYFSPLPNVASPYAAHEHPVVFTGAMDYWPNVDAVVWFAREVLPAIRARDEAVRFYVVGMNPDPAVRALGHDPATVVTGRVDDVRPYLQHARVVVAPLRVARGIQNKVLEAMAMAKPTVATAIAAAGLDGHPGEDLEVATNAAAFAEKVLALIDGERGESLGRRARERVLRDYAWSTSQHRLEALLEASPALTGRPCSVTAERMPLASSVK